MSHQPFETWILDHKVLAPEDRRALQGHLETCTQCRRLHARWQSVRMELQTKRMVAPAPGFTKRYQTGLAERKARAQRQQAWRIFGILFSAALVVLVLLASYVFATTTPSDWLGAIVRTLSSSQDLLNISVAAVQLWLMSTPLAINVAIWIYLTIMLSMLSIIWVLVLWRTNTVGVRNQ